MLAWCCINLAIAMVTDPKDELGTRVAFCITEGSGVGCCYKFDGAGLSDGWTSVGVAN